MEKQKLNLEELLKKAKKSVDSAEVFFSDTTTEQVDFKFDRLHLMDKKNIQSIGLRVIKDGKIGFSSHTNLTDLDGLVENAVASAKFGQPAKLNFPEKVNATPVKIRSEKVEKFDTTEAIKIGNEAIGLIKEFDPGIKCDAGVSKVTSSSRILNSSGLDVSYEQTLFSYALVGVVVIENSFLDVWEMYVKCEMNVPTKEFVEKIIERTKLARKVAKIPTKRASVIFMPRSIPPILSAIMVAVNGKQIQKKSSPLINRLNNKLLDEKLSITDDGTVDFLAGSAPFDDEGIATRPTSIIEKGVLKNFIFDLQTAGILNLASTGNGQRGPNTLPSPNANNWVVSPGEWKLDDMIKDIKEGLIIYDTIGGGQSNILAGDFSVNIGLGYKIENGEITGRVKDTMVSGNVYEAFNDIIGLGSVAEDIHGNLRTPAFYLGNVSVVSK